MASLIAAIVALVIICCILAMCIGHLYTRISSLKVDVAKAKVESAKGDAGLANIQGMVIGELSNLYLIQSQLLKALTKSPVD